MRCMAALLESLVGALVDEEHLCLLLLSIGVPTTVTPALCHAGGCGFRAGSAYKKPIADSIRAFANSCEFPFHLSRTVNNATRFKARHRLEISRGISAASRE